MYTWQKYDIRQQGIHTSLSGLLLANRDERLLGHHKLRPSVNVQYSISPYANCKTVCVGTRARCLCVQWAAFV